MGLTDRPVLLVPAQLCLLLHMGCGAQGSAPPAVAATYDQKTGKLSQLTINENRDGKPNIFSHMEGSRFVRIDVDRDEDGVIDRWDIADVPVPDGWVASLAVRRPEEPAA